ncbi:MAG: hypothetical protein OXL40_00760, partial [Bacteroidota bacterium]|nr:hypothetical protein [Bacteroidota bacterium]
VARFVRIGGTLQSYSVIHFVRNTHVMPEQVSGCASSPKESYARMGTVKRCLTYSATQVASPR